MDMDLGQVADIAEIIGMVTIFTGLVFGGFQIRLHRRQQQNAVATQLSQTFLCADLAHAVVKLQALPDGISAVALRERGAAFEEAAVVVTTSFETMGLAVKRGFADMDLVMDLAGGMLGVMWRKLYLWQETVRLEQGQPSWAEWFEWLAMRSYARKQTATYNLRPIHPHPGAPAEVDQAPANSAAVQPTNSSWRGFNIGGAGI
ncbi:MAG: hypothetical protein AAF513_04530 [Pseudomonadota bacterium]